MIELPELESYYADMSKGYVIRKKKGDFPFTASEGGEIIRRCKAYEGLVAENGEQKKHIEALKSVCENYIPADKMDEANNKVILLSKGNIEEIGRKLLAKQALAEPK